MYNEIQNMSDEPFFSPSNSSVSLNQLPGVRSKVSTQKGCITTNKLNIAVSGQGSDLQDVATAMPLFCLCLQNNPVPTERAKAQAVHRPLWVLGAQGGTAAWLNRLSVLTLCPVQLECLHSRMGVYSPWDRFIQTILLQLLSGHLCGVVSKALMETNELDIAALFVLLPSVKETLLL